MPVYRLTPRESAKASPRWQASTLRPYCLWVSTSNAQEARQTVAQATAVPFIGGGKWHPWCDEILVACERDDKKHLASGIIRVRNRPPDCSSLLTGG